MRTRQTRIRLLSISTFVLRLLILLKTLIYVYSQLNQTGNSVVRTMAEEQINSQAIIKTQIMLTLDIADTEDSSSVLNVICMAIKILFAGTYRKLANMPHIMLLTLMERIFHQINLDH